MWDRNIFQVQELQQVGPKLGITNMKRFSTQLLYWAKQLSISKIEFYNYFTLNYDFTIQLVTSYGWTGLLLQGIRRLTRFVRIHIDQKRFTVCSDRNLRLRRIRKCGKVTWSSNHQKEYWVKLPFQNFKRQISKDISKNSK